MSVVGKRYTLINVCEELSGNKVTSIVFHGYRVAGGGGCSHGFFGQVEAV